MSKRRPQPAGWRYTMNQWGGLPVLGSVAVALVAVGALIWFNRPGGGETTAIDSGPRTQVSGRTQGDPKAAIKIVEYADFQCPFCKKWVVETAAQVEREFVETGQVQVEYRYFAFLGEESKQAAEAAECAADQNAFWQMHDVLYSHQGAENSGVYSTGNLKKYASEVAKRVNGFDTGKFNACLDSGSKRAIVDTLTQQARQAGVSSTPTFTVNGLAVVGAQPIDVFRTTIERAKSVKP